MKDEDTAMRDKVMAIMDKWAVSAHPTGSRYICDPAPADTDEDFVCLADNNLLMKLQLIGAVAEGDPEQYAGMSDFVSMRLGGVNIIVTDDLEFYRRFVEATEEAKSLNLLKKSDRIALFQKRLYGAETDEVPL